ncbi:MAG: hypothetical protein HQK96_20465 [Nitrospirae bacterium]|nr:hypothetical protein [Nitrospirota bacterium]
MLDKGLQMRNNLIISSAYIAAYEMLNSRIIDFINDINNLNIYMHGIYLIDTTSYNNNSPEDKMYLQNKALHHMLYNNVINYCDFSLIPNIRIYRNYLAHNMEYYIFAEPLRGTSSSLYAMKDIFYKIEMWCADRVDRFINPCNNKRTINAYGVVNSMKLERINQFVKTALTIDESMKEGGFAGVRY